MMNATFSTTVVFSLILFTFEKLSFMSKTCWDILYFFCNLHQLATSPLQKVQGFFWPLALNRRRPTIIFLLEAHVRVSREPSPLTDYYWTWKEKKILSSSTLTSLLSIYGFAKYTIKDFQNMPKRNFENDRVYWWKVDSKKFVKLE